MTVLDRLVAVSGLRRWMLVLGLGTFLVLLGDFVAQMGFYLGAITSGRGGVFLRYYGCLLPSFLGTWLPLSVLVAAMFTAGPMLRQGNLMALSAAGIPPRRAFRAFLVLAVVAVLGAFAIADLAVPRLGPAADRAYAALKQDLRMLHGSRFRTVAWRDGDTRWSSMIALPEVGAYFHVYALRPIAGGGWHCVRARTMAWKEEGWRLEDVDVAQADVHQALAACSPSAAGLELSSDGWKLAEVLRPDSSRSSEELYRTGSPRFSQVLCNRLAWSLLPLLCLLYGLPGFIRFADRLRPGAAVVRSLFWALLPVACLGVLSRLLVSAGAHPWPLSIGICGALLVFGWLRWVRMRL